MSWSILAPMKFYLGVLGLLLFVAGSAAGLFVRLRLKPPAEELDDYYWEVEDRHPGYARYQKWSRITFAAAAAGLLLLFIAAAF